MRAFLQNCQSRRFWWVVSVVCAGVILSCSRAADAQVTQIYSFEPDLQGFVVNGDVPTPHATVSLETSGLGATDGQNSLKYAAEPISGFEAALTQNLHPIFTDPLGLDFIRFDLTNTNRFVPPPTDPPTLGLPTFADISVTFFGEFATAPGVEKQIQFEFSQVALGNLEPGTHTIEIDLRDDGGEFLIGGGIDTGTNGTDEIGGYNFFRTERQFVPFSFQIYLNKSQSGTNPAFAWTIYMDNIRAGRDVVGVPGDFNVDGSVDAADYVVWRKNDGTNNALPNDNGLGTPITGAHYDLWRANFGGPLLGVGAASAVPEPSSILLLIVGAMCCGRKTCGRGGV